MHLLFSSSTSAAKNLCRSSSLDLMEVLAAIQDQRVLPMGFNTCRRVPLVWNHVQSNLMMRSCCRKPALGKDLRARAIARALIARLQTPFAQDKV